VVFRFNLEFLVYIYISNKSLDTPTGKNAPSKKFFTTPLSIESLFNSVPDATLDKFMIDFAERIKTTFVVPILLGAPDLVIEKKNTVATLKYKKEAFIPGINKTSSLKGMHTRNLISQDQDDQFDCVQNLKVLGTFLDSSMFSGNSSGCAKARDFFAKALYPGLMSSVYSKCIYPNLPSDKSDLIAFSEKCRGAFIPFEEEWKSHGIQQRVLSITRYYPIM
jgi:hypothetical protein